MENKYKQVKVTLDINDHVKLQNHCREQGVSMASFFRDLVSFKIDDIRKPRVKKEFKVADPKLLYELNRIGVNLNQIAEHSNQHKMLDLQVLTHLVMIEKKLKKLLK
jgi:hypothetical protein